MRFPLLLPLCAVCVCAVDPVVDQAIRELAVEYAYAKLGTGFHAQRGAMASVCSTLHLNATDSPYCARPTKQAPNSAQHATPLNASGSNLGAVVFYVAPTVGDDNAVGSRSHPFRTVQRAQQAARVHPGSSATVYLATGRYELVEPLTLSSADSGTTFAVWPGHAEGSAVLSGGMELELHWETAHLNGLQVLTAKLPSEAAHILTAGLRTLLVDGRQQVRARWPNANPEKEFFPDGYATGAWGGWADLGKVTRVNVTTPIRTKVAQCICAASCTYSPELLAFI